MSGPSCYPTVHELKIVQMAEALMRDAMSQYDPSHDALHVNRVRNVAMVIARAQSVLPDLLVVEVAALLHDLFDKKYVSVTDPTEYLEPFFRDAFKNSGIDLTADDRAALIMRIIEHVSWTTESKLSAEGKLEEWHEKCVELHCVQDADRLDAIGAIGVMRCAAFSAVKNRPLCSPSDDPDDTSAIHHFHDKLLKIKDRLKTKIGKQMGESRHQFMLQFLEAIETEVKIEM